MTANGYGAQDKVSKTGDTMTGTLTLSGSPPVQVNSTPVTLSGGQASSPILIVQNTTSTPSVAALHVISQAAGDRNVGVGIATDTQRRLIVDSNGKLQWGPGGNTTQDTNLYRSSAGTITTDGNLAVGGNVTAGSGPLNALANAWTTYTPTWTANTTNPTIGNGTITAHYAQAGKLVCYTGRILMGSTTTFGSGNWQVSVPVLPNTGSLNVGSALFFSASASDHAGICWFYTSSTLIFTPGGGGEANPTNPQTWAANDQLRWAIVYESA